MSKLEPLDAIQLAIDDHKAYAKQCSDYKFIDSLIGAKRLCAKAPLLVEARNVLKALLNHCDAESDGETGFERAVIAARVFLAKLESED